MLRVSFSLLLIMVQQFDYLVKLFNFLNFSTSITLVLASHLLKLSSQLHSLTKN
jgi:hypothetical protein